MKLRTPTPWPTLAAREPAGRGWLTHGALRGLAVLALAWCWPASAAAAPPDGATADGGEPLPTVDAKVSEMVRRGGLLTLHVDEAHGRLWLEVPPPRTPRGLALELLYVEGLLQGLGSNPIGLDRGQLGDARLLAVRRLGPKVLFEERNTRYRAASDSAAEQRAADESFATSILFGAEIGALDEDGRSLVDLTPFLLRDAHGVARTLHESEQGAYQLDPARSAVDLDRCLAFPDNVELEAVLTYSAKDADGALGGEVRGTVPDPEAITLVQHHSFIRLPDDGYRPRRLDPRIGAFGIEFLDYAADLAEPIRRRWISRHRLLRIDPEADRSAAVEPIVYYVDRGAPEPVRSALVEGAGWWAAAFEAAGFDDAFRVELLPEGAHPLDVRYNVIQWVHRSTRGWSYGGGVIDPRSGEIVKGHVTLGSLRVRQDRLLFEGLAGTEKTGSGEADDPIQLALARIRQLAAHEVGHTLGLAHNFAASTYGGRASVMDYPAPWVRVTAGGELDFSRAYATGVGEWDVHAIRYAYGHLPAEEEDESLAALVADGLRRGLLFLTDRDARPAGAAEPRASLWDNGDDPVAALEETLAVRRIALERFGEDNVMAGTPLAELEEVLAPLYFHHRYQLDAAVKVIGGLEYTYAVRGDGQAPTRWVDAARQRRGLEVVLGLLEPSALDLPETVLALLAPRPFGWSATRETFASATSPAFDALGAAATAADQAVAALLQPERLARLVDFHRRQPHLPGIEEVLRALLDAAFSRPRSAEARDAELERLVETVVVERLLSAAGAPRLRPGLRGWIEWSLDRARQRLAAEPLQASAEAAHSRSLLAVIERFERRASPSADTGPLPFEPPPGSPIGMAGLAGCGFGG